MEASFGPDQEGPLDQSEQELEDEILQEVEESEAELSGSPTETEVDEVGGGGEGGGGEDEGGGNQHLERTEPPVVLTTEYELPVYSSKTMKEPMQMTMMDTTLLGTDADSCLGLSIDRSSAPSAEPPLTIEAAFAMETRNGTGRYVFEPLPMLQVIGHVRDTETGESFEVYTDGPLPPVKDIDYDTITMGSGKSDEEEDDTPWCSAYFFIRAFGLVCVVGIIAGLILLSVYGN